MGDIVWRCRANRAGQAHCSTPAASQLGNQGQIAVEIRPCTIAAKMGEVHREEERWSHGTFSWKKGRCQLLISPCSTAIFWFLTVLVKRGNTGKFEITDDRGVREATGVLTGRLHECSKMRPRFEAQRSRRMVENCLHLFSVVSLRWQPQLTSWTIKKQIENTQQGDSRWLRLCTSNAGGAGLIPAGGTKISHASQCDQNTKVREKKNTHTHTGGKILGFFF